LGDAQAQFKLGQRYENGLKESKDGKEKEKQAKDPQVAAKLYEAAAKQNHKEAALALARLYTAGLGVARDSELAKKYLAIGKGTT